MTKFIFPEKLYLNYESNFNIYYLELHTTYDLSMYKYFHLVFML